MKTAYVLLTIAICFFVLTASAQQGINYKAIISDSNGDILANTEVTLQFTILKNGTTNVYIETHTATTDANGITIVNIGEGTVKSGDFNSIDWGSSPHFLKIEIDKGEGLTDMGATEFKAVPYALHSKTAEDAATKLEVDELKSRIEYLENTIDIWSANFDDDEDGFTENQGDCNDSNANIYPGAPCNDGIECTVNDQPGATPSGNDMSYLMVALYGQLNFREL